MTGNLPEEKAEGIRRQELDSELKLNRPIIISQLTGRRLNAQMDFTSAGHQVCKMPYFKAFCGNWSSCGN